MLGKTHLAVGIAAALAVTQPTAAAGCFLAAIGGAVGGTVCDVDTVRGSRGSGAMQCQIFAAALTAGSLILDRILGLGLRSSLSGADHAAVLFGTVLFAALWIFGFWSGHRSFTHSLLAMVLFGWAMHLISPAVSLPFLAGYGSHLALDLLNKRPLRLLYPLDFGVCLGIFYAGKGANRAFIWGGCLVSAVLILRAVAG